MKVLQTIANKIWNPKGFRFDQAPKILNSLSSEGQEVFGKQWAQISNTGKYLAKADARGIPINFKTCQRALSFCAPDRDAHAMHDILDTLRQHTKRGRELGDTIAQELTSFSWKPPFFNTHPERYFNGLESAAYAAQQRSSKTPLLHSLFSVKT